MGQFVCGVIVNRIHWTTRCYRFLAYERRLILKSIRFHFILIFFVSLHIRYPSDHLHLDCDICRYDWRRSLYKILMKYSRRSIAVDRCWVFVCVRERRREGRNQPLHEQFFAQLRGSSRATALIQTIAVICSSFFFEVPKRLRKFHKNYSFTLPWAGADLTYLYCFVTFTCTCHVSCLRNKTLQFYLLEFDRKIALFALRLSINYCCFFLIEFDSGLGFFCFYFEFQHPLGGLKWNERKTKEWTVLIIYIFF